VLLAIITQETERSLIHGGVIQLTPNSSKLPLHLAKKMGFTAALPMAITLSVSAVNVMKPSSHAGTNLAKGN
jgi:hypothetical protein